jgi:hypothetical protein
LIPATIGIQMAMHGYGNTSLVVFSHPAPLFNNWRLL